MDEKEIKEKLDKLVVTMNCLYVPYSLKNYDPSVLIDKNKLGYDSLMEYRKLKRLLGEYLPPLKDNFDEIPKE